MFLYFTKRYFSHTVSIATINKLRLHFSRVNSTKYLESVNKCIKLCNKSNKILAPILIYGDMVTWLTVSMEWKWLQQQCETCGQRARTTCQKIIFSSLDGFKKCCPGSLISVKTFGKLQLFLGQNKMNHKGVKYQYCLSTKSIGVTVLHLSTVTCDAYVLMVESVCWKSV